MYLSKSVVKLHWHFAGCAARGRYVSGTRINLNRWLLGVSALPALIGLAR
jgi:hypothetical protein